MSRTRWRCCALPTNPRDRVAGFRVAQLLPGVGPASADKIVAAAAADDGFATLAAFAAPAKRARRFRRIRRADAAPRRTARPGRAILARRSPGGAPTLEESYDDAPTRAADLDALERIAATFPSRERFLAELTLDPPDATSDEAGPPLRDEDYLILSTIHSAKGQEWKSVFVLNCVDGCIPSDLATGSSEEIEEERRLLYVAMTRARDDADADRSAALLRAWPAQERRPACLRQPHPLHSGAAVEALRAPVLAACRRGAGGARERRAEGRPRGAYARDVAVGRK